MKFIKFSFLLEQKNIILVSPSIKITTDNVFANGISRVISQDKKYCIGYTNVIDKKLMSPPYIVFGDHTECFKIIDTPFVQAADGLKIFKSDSGKIDSYYLYYALSFFYNKTGFYERHFKFLKRTAIPDISLTTQRLIVNVLKKYDDLINVNNLRIEKLDSLSKEIYKHWFIHFRFPGYKTVIFDMQNPTGWILSENIYGTKKPKEWRFDKFINIGKFVRGKNITANEMENGEVKVISAGVSPSGYHNKSNVIGGCLTISSSGANAGYLSLHVEDIWAADCSYCKDNKRLWFLYNTLCFLRPVIKNLQCGAAQPHVYPKNINKICTIIPSDYYIELYCKKTMPFFEEIKKLMYINKNLERQKNFFLKRLMLGKIVLNKEII